MNFGAWLSHCDHDLSSCICLYWVCERLSQLSLILDQEGTCVIITHPVYKVLAAGGVWERGNQFLHLCTHRWAHQAPVDSSKPRNTQTVKLKVSGSKAESEKCECEEGTFKEAGFDSGGREVRDEVWERNQNVFYIHLWNWQRRALIKVTYKIFCC